MCIPVDHAALADAIGRCAGLAVLLEVSAYPKPGNVHRLADFQETRYEHFLASALSISSFMREAAARGIQVAINKLDLNKVGCGQIIRDTISDVLTWQKGGNTSLGTTILLTPLSIAGGMTATTGMMKLETLRQNLGRVIQATTPQDAVHLYEAINLAKPGGLGKAKKFDATDPASKAEILRLGVTLFDIFKMAADYDDVAKEWVTNYSVTFELGYPFFRKVLEQTGELNVATVHVFLRILSENPDTLIARKVGLEKAREVTLKAREALAEGGLMTERGKKLVNELDQKLRTPDHRFNPGTTADLTASTLMVALLDGLRP
jgi:triphosphoribosyl-dephospho-CoA synthase